MSRKADGLAKDLCLFLLPCSTLTHRWAATLRRFSRVLTVTPSEALRMRHQYLQSLHVLANQFGARIVNMSENSIILEMYGKTSRVEAFVSLVKPSSQLVLERFSAV
jgi:acetolactate synthase small subunit